MHALMVAAAAALLGLAAAPPASALEAAVQSETVTASAASIEDLLKDPKFKLVFATDGGGNIYATLAALPREPGCVNICGKFLRLKGYQASPYTVRLTRWFGESSSDSSVEMSFEYLTYNLDGNSYDIKVDYHSDSCIATNDSLLVKHGGVMTDSNQPSFKVDEAYIGDIRVRDVSGGIPRSLKDIGSIYMDLCPLEVDGADVRADIWKGDQRFSLPADHKAAK